MVRGSLYVHWPYCVKRCSYCNFNKYLSPSKEKYQAIEKRMKNALIKEASTLLKFSGFSSLKSVYFGGGTPSLMSPNTIKDFLKSIEAYIEPGAEITLEANPGDVKKECRVNEIKNAGINRLSLGVQSFNDQHLKMMNRDHDSETGMLSAKVCVSVFGGEKTSVDLIYGRNETPNEWLEELNEVLRLGVYHMSLYQLTLERGTSLYNRASSFPSKYDDTIYELTLNQLRNKQWSRYEISNYSKTCYAQSRHNKWYWKGGEYIGIGPGAHGRFIPRVRTSEASLNAFDLIKNKTVSKKGIISTRKQERIQTLDPENWMTEVELVGHGTRKVYELSDYECLIELIASSFRTERGLKEKDWNKSTTLILFSNFIEKLLLKEDLSKHCFVNKSQTSIRLTDSGLKILNQILPYFVSELNDLCYNN